MSYIDNLRKESYFLSFKYNSRYDPSIFDTRITRSKTKKLKRLEKIDFMAQGRKNDNHPVSRNKTRHTLTVSRFLFGGEF